MICVPYIGGQFSVLCVIIKAYMYMYVSSYVRNSIYQINMSTLMLSFLQLFASATQADRLSHFGWLCLTHLNYLLRA